MSRKVDREAILRALPATQYEVIERCGVSTPTASRVLRELLSHNRAHISGYREKADSARGARQAVYSAGAGEDAPPPVLRRAYMMRRRKKRPVERSMSPLGLVQERVLRDNHFPWRVLVCCAFMNRTTKEQARPALSAFFAWWLTPDHFQFTGPRSGNLRALLEPLGLANRREAMLRRMTDDYLARVSPYECFGVGRYARDALDLFCDGTVPSAPVSDHYLGAYADWRLAGGPRIEWDEEGFLEWTLSAGS